MFIKGHMYALFLSVCAFMFLPFDIQAVLASLGQSSRHVATVLS